MQEYTLLKKRFEETVFKSNSDKTQIKAIEKAYADMSRRATGHSPEIKEVCVQWLNKEVFVQSLKIQNFDVWHKNTCEKMVLKLNEKKNGFGTIGRAQKVINMAFKYLSCINDNYDEFIESYHMTLDGYTLAWYKAAVMPWVKEQKDNLDIKELIEWSKINNYEDYILIQKNIRRYLNQSPKYSIKIHTSSTQPIKLPTVPFQAEFIIWEGEIVKEKYGNFVKELNKYIQQTRGIEAGREKDKWLINQLFDDFLKEYCKKFDA